jgi:hypothetical protein
MSNRLPKGTIIECASKEELVEVSTTLEKQGYETDFVFEYNGKTGYWCEIK